MTGKRQQQSAPIRVLVTGFGPFPDTPVNPCEKLVTGLAKAFHSHTEINLRGLILKTEFENCYMHLKHEIDSFRPDLVIAFGVSAGSGQIRLECIARNKISDKRPDATGNKTQSRHIDPDGPRWLFPALPVWKLRGALKKAGVPAALSFSAQTYVCNFLFYNMMRGKIPGGFVHIPHSDVSAPFYTGKKKTAPLPEDTLQEAGRIIIETAVKSLKP